MDEIVNMMQMLEVLWRCDDDSDGKIICSN